MKILRTHAAALFCLLTGILLLLISSLDIFSARTFHMESSEQGKWYLIIGTALCAGGIVRLLRQETI